MIELAVDEARRLNHHYIGTEHLLLGLVREGEGIAAGVLESLGVNLEKVRTQVIHVLQPEQQLLAARSRAHASKTPFIDPLGIDLTDAGPRRQARPGHRPREGDRAGHPDPLAAAPRTTRP